MKRAIFRPALTVFAAISCAIVGSTSDAASRGEMLSQQWCAGCHGVQPGKRSPNPKAPAFAAIAAEPSATDYSLRVFLKTTHATMPNFKIDPDDIDDIVDYIRSLKPGH